MNFWFSLDSISNAVRRQVLTRTQTHSNIQYWLDLTLCPTSSHDSIFHLVWSPVVTWSYFLFDVRSLLDLTLCLTSCLYSIFIPSDDRFCLDLSACSTSGFVLLLHSSGFTRSNIRGWRPYSVRRQFLNWSYFMFYDRSWLGHTLCSTSILDLILPYVRRSVVV